MLLIPTVLFASILATKSIVATGELFMICPLAAEEFNYNYRSGNTLVKIPIARARYLLTDLRWVEPVILVDLTV